LNFGFQVVAIPVVFELPYLKKYEIAVQDAINNNEQLNITLVKRSIKIEPQKQGLDKCHKDR
jgi:hypothetical protein